MNWYKKALKEYEKLKDGEYYLSDFMTPKEVSKGFKIKPEHKWNLVDSSFIKSVKYNKSLKILELKLRNGQEYSYSGVSENTYRNFMKSESKGDFFNRIIKKKYPLKTK